MRGRKNNPKDGYWTTNEVMAYFGIQRPTLYYWMKKGWIEEPKLKLPNGVIYWSEAQIEKLKKTWVME